METTRHRPVHLADRVQVLLHPDQQTVPRAVGRPAAEPLVGGLPRPVPLGQIPPRGPRGQLPQDRVDDFPPVPHRTPQPGHRQQRLDPLPRLISQLMPTHHTPTTNPTTLRIHLGVAARGGFEFVRPGLDGGSEPFDGLGVEAVGRVILVVPAS